MPKASAPLARSRSKRSKLADSGPTSRISAGNPHGSRQDHQSPSRLKDNDRTVYSDQATIGLALSTDVPKVSGSSEPPNLESNLSERGFGIKRTGSRWKNIGSLFGRGKLSLQGLEPSQVNQLDHTQPQVHPVLHQPRAPVATHKRPEPNTLRRKRAPTAQGDAPQMTIKRDHGSLLRRNSSRKRGVGRRKQVEEISSNVQSVPQALHPYAKSEQSQAPPAGLLPPEVSLLQVEIPNVELERYSVMFGDVLNRQSKRQSTLLSRRRMDLEGIKPMDASEDQLDKENLFRPPYARHDSTSSKSSTKAPSFSLFPPSPKFNAGKRIHSKPSPLSRSATTTLNDSAPPAHPAVRKTESQVFFFVGTPQESPSTPIRHDFKPRFDPPSPSVNSTSTGFFEYPEYFAKDAASGQSNDDSKLSYYQRPFPARSDSMKGHGVSKANPRELPIDETLSIPQTNDSSRATDVAISVARQISISKRQQQMLVPITHQKTARQPMRPVLVNSQSTGALRKSHHPTISGSTIGTGL